MNRIVTFIFLTLLGVWAYAGDLYVVENLGFSPDGQYFMFGQHVLRSESSQVHAEAAIVNVPMNDFVTDGWKKKTWKISVYPNFNSRSSLYELLEDMRPLKNRYNISHLKQGRLLYTLTDNDESMLDTETSETVPALLFRDFERGRDFTLILYQESDAFESNPSASFYIFLKVEENSGSSSTYTIGRPGYKRPGVSSYSIARIWLGPNGRSLVIAVAKESPNLDISYMVETLVLR